MKVSTHYKYKVQNQDKQSVMIIFPTEVESSVETVTKSLFSTGKLSLSFQASCHSCHKVTLLNR